MADMYPLSIKSLGLRSVKLNEKIVAAVELNKKRTGTSIGAFFEQAAMEKLNIVPDPGKRRFTKNVVYRINNQKRVCVMVDSEFAVFCKLIPHKNDNGYRTRFSDVVIFSSHMDALTDAVVLGAVDGVSFTKKNN